MGFDLNIKQLLCHPEQARHHLVHREPGAQGFRRNVITLLAQLLAVIADIPGLKILDAVFVFHKRLQLGELLLRLGLGFRRQLIQEFHHLIDTAGHLGGQRTLGVVVESEQLGEGMATLENLSHHRGIVPLRGIRALI